MKGNRQNRILEIIRNYPISTQEELVQRLKDEGVIVTQATISRDIRELSLIKTSRANGEVCYTAPAIKKDKVDEKFARILREGFVSCEAADNIIVLKTTPGIAMAVAAALDSMPWPEIMGCIAGDDTIFCVVHNPVEGMKISKRIHEIAE